MLRPRLNEGQSLLVYKDRELAQLGDASDMVRTEDPHLSAPDVVTGDGA